MSKQEQLNYKDLNLKKLKFKKRKKELNKKIKEFKWRNNNKPSKNNKFYKKLKRIRKNNKKN